ncbi:hypothetical protein C8R44DRAFT_632446 [Mycena epipterygia]|nr:hypothetical protein C8R44DRAFT_632446 [Mycena epipterygia]
MVSTPAGLLASAARRKNPSELGAHICPYSDCGRDFTAKHNLERKLYHMNSHRGIKPYSCGKCGQTFTAPHTRTRHERDTCGIGKPYAKVCPSTVM